jgi:hypothetical protein
VERLNSGSEVSADITGKTYLPGKCVNICIALHISCPLITSTHMNPQATWV